MKKHEFPFALFDYAKDYLYSADVLINQFEVDSLTGEPEGSNRSFMLCSHFLAAHSIELSLKSFISALGDVPPSNTHSLGKLKLALDRCLKNHCGWSASIFDELATDFLKHLDRYETFRYPTDKNWNLIPGIEKEAMSWTYEDAQAFRKKLFDLRDTLDQKLLEALKAPK